MSFLGRQHSFFAHRGKGGTDNRRPILKSMDKNSVRISIVPNGSKPTELSCKKNSQLECAHCKKPLKGASHSPSNKEGTGLCCKKCYNETGRVPKIYCTECMHDRNVGCGTCRRFFCPDCLDRVDLKDRQGTRYCSRKCAKAGCKKNYQLVIQSPVQPTMAGPWNVSNGPGPSANGLVPAATLTRPQPLQSDDNHLNSHACDWCTQGLAVRTSRHQLSKVNVGYHCCKPNCGHKLYCHGCATNHGDFCTGACQQFLCRNCCPYDGWLNAQGEGNIYCSHICVPEHLRSSVVRRNLFDEDWEAEEHFRPLARRCRGFLVSGQPCPMTASHPSAAAKSLKQGYEFCLHHGGWNARVDENMDDDSGDNGSDFYFDP